MLCSCCIFKSCLTLCDLVNCSLAGSAVHGDSPGKILKWVVIPFSRGFSQPRNQTGVSRIAVSFFSSWATREAHKCPCTDASTVNNTVGAQLCPPLCDPMDCSQPGSSVLGIFQVRILEQGAISYSRGSSQPRNLTCVSCVSCIAGRFFTTVPRGKPLIKQYYNLKFC